MNIICLNNSWTIKTADGNFCTNSDLPASALSAFVKSGDLNNPYQGLNETACKDFLAADFVFEKRFTLNCQEAQMSYNLRLEQLDTIATLEINGQSLGTSNNMFLPFECSLKQLLKQGENVLSIKFSSALDFINAEAEKHDITHVPEGCIKGNNFLRKAHYTFGWDWAPQLPDCGIGNALLISDSAVKINFFDALQWLSEDFSTAEINVKADALGEYAQVLCELVHPNGNKESKTGKNCKFTISNPSIWWTNGLGEQPLYEINLYVLDHNKNILVQKTKKIGIRSLSISTEKDNYGTEFCVVLNGKKIFCKGANYVPQDSIHANCSKERTFQLLSDCRLANFNCIRVWGGGYYPEDYFYDICDELGILVWQDFMFACNVYIATDSLIENISKEIEYQALRLKGRTCLMLWCGNNEMEWMWEKHDGMQQVANKEQYKKDYLFLFETLIPKILKHCSIDTFYWPSSPSSFGQFQQPNSFNHGNAHCWEVWHHLKPFSHFKTCIPRFCSEFGFQSFSSFDEIKTFSQESENNIYSPIMLAHQKNSQANSRIVEYMKDNYPVEQNFKRILFLSQIQQADAIKCAVEHWRRNMNVCKGALYWQINDCWPVASWSSIEYSGRWKALHYAAKKFFAPVAITLHEENNILIATVLNDTLNDFFGKIEIIIFDKNEKQTRLLQTDFNVDNLSAKQACLIEKYSNETIVFAKILDSKGNEISNNFHLYCKPKDLALQKPKVTFDVISIEKDLFVDITVNGIAIYLHLFLPKVQMLFSDNFMCLPSGKARVKVLRKDSIVTKEYIKQNLQIETLMDKEE